MVNRYIQETIMQRLQKRYNKLDNSSKKEGLLEAAEAITGSLHTKDVVKTAVYDEKNWYVINLKTGNVTSKFSKDEIGDESSE